MKVSLQRIPLAVLVAIAFGLLAAPAHAQAVYGSIAGVVEDTSGAAVPGASVTVTNLERKTEDTVTTNESGNYSKDRLLPGVYSVKASLSGFKAKVVSRVVVNVDTQTTVRFNLEVGDLTEEVTVTAAEGQLLKTDRADVATTFESKQLTELPVLDRNFTKFVLLTPGTQKQAWQHAASENPQGSTQTTVNGQTFSGTGWQLDGTDNRDVILGIVVVNPTLESIGESKITSQNYDAEFGQATAGIVSVQTKSGTNEIHGSAFGFRQTDGLSARNPFSQPDREDPITGRVLPETKKQQFGASIGGPIVKNQWFFFGDYQGTRNTVGGSKLLTVPTALARQGNFSEYGINIFDPATGDPSQRAQFPGNVIPGDRLSPQALAILNLIPLPNAPGIRDNYIAQGSEKFNGDQFNTRLDGRLSENLNLFGRYSLAKYNLDGPQAFGAGGGSELVSLGGNSKVKMHSVATGFDYTFNSTTVMDVRFGFYQYKVDVLPNDFGSNPATDAGIPGLNISGDPFTSGLPFFEINGGTAQMRFGSGLDAGRCNCPLAQNEKQWQVASNLTKVLGNHTAKFGFDIRRAYNLRVPSDAHRSGQLYFNDNGTRGADGGGIGLATFMLGNVNQQFRRYVSSSTDARERQWRQFFYAQDTWRASDKLTVNYGLRADIYRPQTVNEAGNGGWLDINTGEIRVGGVGDVDLAGNVKSKVNWAPRFGAAYQFNSKTVIRAGYGRSYDTGVFGSIFGHAVTQNLPVLAVQELNPANNFDTIFNLAQGPQAPVFPTPDASGRLPLPNGIFARLLPDTMHVPRVDAWNVTVQREITPTLSGEVGYVGNHGEGFFGDNPAANANAPVLEGFGTLSTNERRPYFNSFGWTQGIDSFCNCATSTYNSLQAKLTKRFSGGYSLLTHYTYQKAKNHNGDYFVNQDIAYGPADFSRTHVFVIAGMAELPFARDAKGLAGAILGGWQVNTNVVIQSGIPFNVTYRGSGADRDTGPNYPDLVGDPDGPKTQDEWFNGTAIGESGSAFGRPAAGTFGNLERNTLRGPGYWNVDASLFKRFKFTDRTNLEFRVEVNNLFNHVNLGQPDGEVGIPGNPNPNAGRITSNAFNGSDPMRNVQFGLRFQF
jgi:outer membrane receptor protein involved in Fe transport